MNIKLNLHLGSIRVLFQKSIVNIHHQYNTQLYTNLHGFVSRQCIQHIGKELERVKFVGTSKNACGCFIRTTYGYLVCVNFPVSKYKENMFFWKKLHIEEHDVNHEDSGTKLNLEVGCEELKTYFNSLDIVG